MFSNYLLTAFRSHWKQKGFTFLNLAGLTIGLATSLMIMLWVVDELSYDGFHQNGKQLYSVMENQAYSGDIYTFPVTPGPLAEALKAEIPEITHATRTSGKEQLQFTVGDKIIKESGTYADPDFLTMFTFPLIAGDANTALNDKYAIIISEALAEKYFGNAKDAMGKAIRIENKKDYTVTGVLQEIPANSTIDFDFLIPFEGYYQENDWLQEWSNNSIPTYVMLDEQADAKAVNVKIKDFIKKYKDQSPVELFLHPFSNAHLYANFENGQQAGGRIIFVRLFMIIAGFILLVACINFMNLVTARSSQRSKEVGVRKVIGAQKSGLIRQFLAESVMLVSVATMLSILVTELLLPWFNQLTDKQMDIPFASPAFLLSLAGVVLITGLLAGMYPAFFLSSFNAVNILKGTFKLGAKGATLRQGLVVFQFVLSMMLIAATVVVYQQIQFIKNKELGIDRENLIYFPTTPNIQAQFDAYKAELLTQPGIQSVTLSDQNPLQVSNSTGDVAWEGKDPNQVVLFQNMRAGYDFLETTGIQLAEGRDFSEKYATDTASLLINEEAARRMGLKDPIGQQVRLWDEHDMQIIGVVKDFHSGDLHEAIEPLFIMLKPTNAWMTMVRTKAGEAQQALASLEAMHNRFDAGYVFEYNFVDQDFERMYRTDTLIGKMAACFTLIAILISCLGLFGLAAYTAERRVKEIGVRKVLGASVGGLVTLLSGNFTKLVLIAFVVATPISWWLLSLFLKEYAYHVALSPLVFLAAGLLTLMITWLTVSYHSVRAALANPVDSLRAE